MKIACLTTFLHNHDRYEAGDVRTVPDNLGMLFVGHGWASDVSGETPSGHPGTGSADLEIQSSNLTSGDNHG